MLLCNSISRNFGKIMLCLRDVVNLAVIFERSQGVIQKILLGEKVQSQL